MTMWKSILATIVGAVMGGAIPSVKGDPKSEIIGTAIAGALIALVHLWQNKPGTPTA